MEAFSTRDKLLLSQTVYEVGEGDWERVSGLFANHPLVKLAPEQSSPEVCRVAYLQLAGHMPSETNGIGDHVRRQKPRGAFHLRLAQKYYAARVAELREALVSNETEFTKRSTELTQLRKGELDVTIREELRKNKTTTKSARAAGKSKSKEERLVAPPTPIAQHPIERASPRSPPSQSPQREARQADSVTLQPGAAQGTSVPLRGASAAVAEAMEVDVPSPAQSQADASQASAPKHLDPQSATLTETGPDAEGDATTRKRRASVAHGERPTKKRQAVESPPATPGGPIADVKRHPMWSLKSGGNPKKLLGLVHDQVSGLSSSGIFLKDIAIHEYDQLIKQPTSLASIKRRITGKTDPITTMEGYMAEVFHMVCNAIMFNGPHTTTHEDAFKMLDECQQVFQDYVANDGSK